MSCDLDLSFSSNFSVRGPQAGMCLIHQKALYSDRCLLLIIPSCISFPFGFAWLFVQGVAQFLGFSTNVFHEFSSRHCEASSKISSMTPAVWTFLSKCKLLYYESSAVFSFVDNLV